MVVKGVELLISERLLMLLCLFWKIGLELMGGRGRLDDLGYGNCVSGGRLVEES